MSCAISVLVSACILGLLQALVCSLHKRLFAPHGDQEQSGKGESKNSHVQDIAS